MTDEQSFLVITHEDDVLIDRFSASPNLRFLTILNYLQLNSILIRMQLRVIDHGLSLYNHVILLRPEHYIGD